MGWNDHLPDPNSYADRFPHLAGPEITTVHHDHDDGVEDELTDEQADEIEHSSADDAAGDVAFYNQPYLD